jgi:hypothetical protein
VVINELPDCKHKEDNAQLNLMSGVPIKINAGDWGDAERIRYIRASPVLPDKSIHPQKFKARNPQAPLPDGSFWYPTDAAKKTKDRPVTLRRFYPVLLQRALTTQRENFKDYEKLTLASLRVMHPKGMITYAHVTFFLVNLGLWDTPVKGIQQMLPCFMEMDKDGSRATANLHPEQKQWCMQKFACMNCQKSYHCLGGSWHRPSMAEATTRVMTEALNFWTGTGQATWYEWKAPPHICDASCPKRRRPPDHDIF